MDSGFPIRPVAAAVFAVLVSPTPAFAQDGATTRTAGEIDEIMIIGDAGAARQTTGAAHVVTAEELERFQYSDIQRIVRQIPGVAVQIEDGYGLRPNLSIRGTASDRSGRITLLEDGVLIAPAPYAAPAAYYFPTTARISQVEVLKGPSAVTQGPYTIGGAMNLISTPIPRGRAGRATLDFSEDATRRLHAHYGAGGERFGWLAETHLWESAGYQRIDLAGGDTGLDKDDWMLKFRVNSDPGAEVFHQLDVKLQLAEEVSQQSYLGLTDTDFAADPFRRYAVSQLDQIDTRHEQAILRYRVEFGPAVSFTATAYRNNHARDWFKTEAFATGGSAGAGSFSGTSWFDVIQAVNRGDALGGFDPEALSAVLSGADTAPGSVLLRNNAREYVSRGVQFGVNLDLATGAVRHDVQIGLRLHEDDEDRLQRNATYHMQGGRLMLDDPGVNGNAGNQIELAESLAFHVYDRIRFGDWTINPGVRYERVERERVRFETRPGFTDDPGSRDAANLRDTRANKVDVWIPGVGVLYAINPSVSVFGGIHRGFTAPGSASGAREEKSVNYELGVRAGAGRLYADITAFRTDYDNLLGICTASTGAQCEVGDVFNGDAAKIDGLEVALNYDFSTSPAYAMPFVLSYTHMDGRFQSNIADTQYFGNVSAGDRIPYIPRNELFASFGFERARFSGYLSGSYVDEVCVRAACAPYESTASALIFDIAGHFALSEQLRVSAKIENLTDDVEILGRHPYGARGNRGRTGSVGMAIRF
jgi:Fe(3+) dicitrate transport protein